MIAQITQFSLWATALFSCAIIIFTLRSKTADRKLAITWMLFNAMVGCWAAFWWAGAFYLPDPHSRWISKLIANMDAIGIAPAFVVFVQIYLGRNPSKDPIIRASIIFSGLLFISAVLFPRAFIPSLQKIGSAYLPVAGPLLWVFAVQYTVLTLTGVLMLLFSLRTQSYALRNKTKYILVGCFIGFLGGATTFPPALGITKQYPYGVIVIPIYSFLITYAIFKHQLIDITVVIRKTVIYSLVSATLIGLYMAVIGVLSRTLEIHFSHGSLLFSAAATGVIALMFHPLQAYLQHWLDRRFPRESLDQALLREATSDFVHEIKRPLTNISMPAQLALKDLEQFGQHMAVPSLRRKLEFILQESLEAGQTIEAIRALSAHSATAFKPVNLSALFRKLLDREQSRLAESHITVVRDFPEPGIFIDGDSKQLEVALGNIVKNAIDALQDVETTARQLRLAVHRQSDHIVVEIEDNGKGIAKSDLGKLFDPWFSTKGAAGMGIGLFLTREILRLHNASIDVKSEESCGTCFRVSFSNPQFKTSKPPAR
jgi:signal transduction histidine kinase